MLMEPEDSKEPKEPKEIEHPNLAGLSMEKNLSYFNFSQKVEKMSLEQAQTFCRLLYAESLQKEQLYAKIVAERWSGVSSIKDLPSA